MPQDLLVYSTYDSRSKVDHAVKELKKAGFSSDDITVLDAEDTALEKSPASGTGAITLSVHCEDPDSKVRARQIIERTGGRHAEQLGDTRAV